MHGPDSHSDAQNLMIASKSVTDLLVGSCVLGYKHLFSHDLLCSLILGSVTLCSVWLAGDGAGGQGQRRHWLYRHSQHVWVPEQGWPQGQRQRWVFQSCGWSVATLAHSCWLPYRWHMLAGVLWVVLSSWPTSFTAVSQFVSLFLDHKWN